MNKWTMIKKSAEDWKVIEKDNKYQIEGPKGLYKDENGKIYEFDTREKALEEVEYLKAEHKYDKKEAKLKKKAGNVEYYVKAYWGEINKDNYEKGEYERVRTFSEKGDGKPFESALDAANGVLATFGFNAIIDKSLWNIERDEKGLRYETSIEADENDYNDYYVEVDMNSERYQQFKKGEIDLYAFTFVILIGKRQEVDFDDSEI